MPRIEYTRPWLADYQLDAVFNDARISVVEGPQPLDEVVYTPEGPTTIGSISVGDLVIGPSGDSTRVVAVDDVGERDVFEVEFRDGATVQAASSHPWVLHGSRGERVYTTEEIYNFADNTLYQKHIPTTQPVRFNPSDVNIDPWMLGVLLGDGSISGKSISLANNDEDIVRRFQSLLPEGYDMYERDAGRGDSYAVVARNRFAARSRPENGVRYRKNGWEVSISKDGYVGRYNTKSEAIEARDKALREKYGEEYIAPQDNIIYNLEQLGLWGKTCHDKFVPEKYKYGSVEQRLEILRGLLDTDGSVSRVGSTARFEVTSRQLAKDVQFLVRSLGGRCSIVHRDKSHIDGHHDSWRCNISHDAVSKFVWCPSKRERSPDDGVKNVRKIRDVRKVGRKEVRCIEVGSDDHLYLTTGMTTTHNSVQSGKAQPLGSSVFTPYGPKRMGDIEKGDEVVGRDGTPKKVLGVFPQGKKEVYRLHFRDGTTAEATGDHLWYLGSYDYGKERVKTTDYLRDISEKSLYRTWVPYVDGSVEFYEKDIPIDPYLLGVIIAEGGVTQSSLTISCGDREVIERITAELDDGFDIVKKNGDNVDYTVQDTNSVKIITGGVGSPNNNRIILKLKALGLWGKHSHEKFIPDIYKYNTVEVRKEVLRGIFDGDGWVNTQGQARIGQTSKRLAEDVREVVASLGGTMLIQTKESDEHRDVYRGSVQYDRPSDLFWLDRKAGKCRPKTKSQVRRRIERIEYVGEKETQCIKVEGSAYLTEDFILTHNTLACEIWAWEYAWNNEDATVWWVSRNSTTAGLAFEELVDDLLPQDVKDKAITRTIRSKGDQRIDLLNGATIKFLSADKPDSLYGDTVSACVVDEASRVAEEARNAVTTRMSATGGPIRYIGNVTGRNNWFWRLARYAEQGEDWTCEDCGNSFTKDHHYAKITVIDSLKAGISDPEYVKQEYATMDEQSFMKSYLSEAPDDGGNPFGIDHIDQIVNDSLPESKDTPAVAWGWDIAKDQNYTVGIGLDRDGDVVEYYRWKKESFASQLARMTDIVGTTPALIDATGGSHGDQLLERLKDAAGENWRGVKFNGKTKQDLMQGLAVAIQNGDIQVPDGQVVKELKNFEYEERRSYTIYSAPDKLNDDCVDALALAVKQWREMNQMPPDAAPIGMTGVSGWSL